MGDVTPRGETVRTFVDEILFQARMRPEQPAIALSDRLVTYAMFAQGVSSVEARLRALGLASDELVAVAVTNPIRHLILVAALFRIGQPSVSTNHIEEVPNLRSGVRFCFQDTHSAPRPGITPIPIDDRWFRPQAPSPEAAEGFAHWDSICRVEVTSGSTGRPRAIASTVEEFEYRLAAQRVVETFGVCDRVLMLIGLTGGWGFRAAVRVLASGGTLVYADSLPSALPMASAFRVDAVVASTAHVRDLVQSSMRAPLSGAPLRALLLGGGLATRTLLTEARARLCAQTLVQYGATESGPIAVTPADLLVEEGATGYPLPGVSIEIVDSDDRGLPVGASGVVRVRTPAMGRVFPRGADDGHLNLRGGWFYPGDRGRLSADGLLTLEGRTSEVINSGGVKRAPELIEEIALRHPSVAEAAAFGALGAGGIDEICLAVVTRAAIDERQMIEWCGQRGLKVARVFLVDALPRTPLGKIMREDLKARLIG
jgi:acyl-coenzyme A synthetase/AMP-(fatty) acid ligase